LYEISTTQFDNKHRRVDIHSVRCGNRLAYEMPLAELHAAVRKMGVPRISPEMGAQDVILRLGVFQLEQLEQAAD
jgi:hypothetical protein